MSTSILSLANLLISFCFFVIIYFVTKTFLPKIFIPSLFSEYSRICSDKSPSATPFIFLLVIISIYLILNKYYQIPNVVKVFVLMLCLYISIGTLPYSIMSKLVVVMLYTCIILFSDIMIGFYITFLKVSWSVVIVDLLVYVLALVLTLTIFIIFAFITKKQSRIIITLLVIDIFIIVVSSLWVQKQEINKNILFILLNNFFFLLLNAIVILLMDYYNHTKEKLKEKQQISEMYVKTVEQINEHIEKFKHDLKNIATTISTVPLYDELKRIIAEFEKERIVITNIEKIPDSDIKLFIMNKVIKIFQSNISLYFLIDDNVNIPRISKIDFIRLLGNLIDNAIENAERTDNKTIVLIWGKNSLTVQNSFLKEYDIDLQQIYNKGYSTKKNSKGLGLSVVQDILNKYSQILSLNTCIENDFFIQHLVWVLR